MVPEGLVDTVAVVFQVLQQNTSIGIGRGNWHCFSSLESVDGYPQHTGRSECKREQGTKYVR